ncbi:hypothetical protein DASB73_037680 [Starmerella bacillaris]|uniref:Uncharacterized protein n=1 Tax=Starmerella bacillaris TaxID=1247836 RepID=A0AAV5RMZ9_STABA|nr:hypothetical protein DASB73_037680 [Starmerella bacillaris]
MRSHITRKPVGSGSDNRPSAEYSPLGKIKASPYINTLSPYGTNYAYPEPDRNDQHISAQKPVSSNHLSESGRETVSGTLPNGSQPQFRSPLANVQKPQQDVSDKTDSSLQPSSSQTFSEKDSENDLTIHTSQSESSFQYGRENSDSQLFSARPIGLNSSSLTSSPRSLRAGTPYSDHVSDIRSLSDSSSPRKPETAYDQYKPYEQFESDDYESSKADYSDLNDDLYDKLDQGYTFHNPYSKHHNTHGYESDLSKDHADQSDVTDPMDKTDTSKTNDELDEHDEHDEHDDIDRTDGTISSRDNRDFSDKFEKLTSDHSRESKDFEYENDSEVYKDSLHSRSKSGGSDSYNPVIQPLMYSPPATSPLKKSGIQPLRLDIPVPNKPSEKQKSVHDTAEAELDTAKAKAEMPAYDHTMKIVRSPSQHRLDTVLNTTDELQKLDLASAQASVLPETNSHVKGTNELNEPLNVRNHGDIEEPRVAQEPPMKPLAMPTVSSALRGPVIKRTTASPNVSSALRGPVLSSNSKNFRGTGTSANLGSTDSGASSAYNPATLVPTPTSTHGPPVPSKAPLPLSGYPLGSSAETITQDGSIHFPQPYGTPNMPSPTSHPNSRPGSTSEYEKAFENEINHLPHSEYTRFANNSQPYNNRVSEIINDEVYSSSSENLSPSIEARMYAQSIQSVDSPLQYGTKGGRAGPESSGSSEVASENVSEVYEPEEQIKESEPTNAEELSSKIGSYSAYVQRLRVDAGETHVSKLPMYMPFGLRGALDTDRVQIKPEFLRKVMDIRYTHLPKRMIASEVDDDDDDISNATGITPMHSQGQMPDEVIARPASPVESVIEPVGKIKLFVANPDDL